MPRIEISRKETDTFTYSVTVTDRQLDQLKHNILTPAQKREFFDQLLEEAEDSNPIAQEPFESEDWTHFFDPAEFALYYVKDGE